MYIAFKSITWKNFLSTGAAGNTIHFQDAPMTIITGASGSGKSTILCALTFALFGKAFRDINKANLINTINQKNCLVEVIFSIGSTEYKVVRGIKPNVFEIYSDGVLINQSAASRDYQRILEQQILKLNYKTFTQLVILGSSSYTPFMQLPSAQRREVIEDILDISVFSLMNSILKDRILQTKNELASIDSNIRQCKDSAMTQQKLIDALVGFKADQIVSLMKDIELNETDIATNLTRIESLNDRISELLVQTNDLNTINDDLKKLTRLKTKLSTKKDTIEETISFFQDHETCPSCSQNIPHDHKINVIQTADAQRLKYENDINILESALDNIIQRQQEIESINNTIVTFNLEINQLVNTNKALSQQNKKLESQVSTIKSDTDNINIERDNLKKIAESIIFLDEKKKVLLEDKNTQDITLTLLKDTGIKSNIIKEYIPIMNKLINKYLGLMDMFVQFELDENFDEIIRSRHRDIFTYSNFSEGEKLRIDLSIMFAWRQISKMKNSVNTNLLIMDEIVDNRLEIKTVELFLQIVRNLDNTHVFIISHRDDILDKFEKNIHFTKRNEFSIMTVN